MDQNAAMDILSGASKTPGARLARLAMGACGISYSAAVRLRRWAYRRGLLPSHAAAAPVISIGNITTGGTGKTPMVAWVARQLMLMDRRPAIVLRGYKAAGGRSDEAELLAGLLEGRNEPIPSRPAAEWTVPVIVDPNRVRGAGKAIGQGADVIVLDDGFQHLRLRRDLDIVLIDATNPFGFGYVLPRGLLREPPSALQYADAIVITRCDAIPPADLEALRRNLAVLAPAASIHTAIHAPTHIIDPHGATVPLEALANRKVLAFCGVGNPEAFFTSLGHLGAVMVDKMAFGDHVHYGPDQMDSVSRAADRCGAEILVTTQKDRVKLDPAAFTKPLWTLAVEIQFPAGRDELMERIRRAMQG